MIDRNNPIPLYIQFIQIIKESLNSGELKPGDTIPTEMEYMKKYDISRATVRHAILQLVNEGYLRRIKAKGTYVNIPEKPRFLGNLIGFAEEMQQRGISFTTKVLDKRIIKAPNEVAQRLQIATGDEVFYLKRQRFVKGEPVLLAEGYIPHRLFPSLEDEDYEKNSLYDILETKYGVYLDHGYRDIRPMIPSKNEDMKLLNISAHTPILFAESVVYTKEETPIEYVELKLRGTFRVDIVNTSNL